MVRKFVVAGIVFCVFTPFWLGYLSTDQRLWPTWDPGAHFNEGLMLYEQFVRLDLISFLYQIIQFGFWLPVHPLLVFVSQLFSPHQIDAAVFLNFFIVSAGFGSIVQFMRASRQSLGVHALFVPVLLVSFAMALQQSTPWVYDMNRVMLEPLCLILTLLVIVCSAVGQSRGAAIFLFLLFMTKIHYGLYLLPGALVSTDVMRVKSELLSEVRSFFRTKLSKVISIFVAVGTLLIIFRFIHGPWQGLLFGRKVSFNSYHQVIWLVLFMILLGFTQVFYSMREVIRERARMFYDLMVYTLLPFGFYYLMPIKHKIKPFLENAGYVPQGPKNTNVLEDYFHFFKVIFNEYLGVDLAIGALSVLVISAFIFTTQKRWKKALIVPLIHVATFTLLMGKVALFKEARFGVSLLAIFIGLTLIWAVEAFSSRIRLQIVLMTICFVFIGFQIQRWPTIDSISAKTASVYLPVNDHDLNSLLPKVDFSKTTILWGLQMDHVTPKVFSEFLTRVPKLSSYWNRPEYYINDLGYEGLRAPQSFIENKWATTQVDQLIFYLPGISTEIGTIKNYKHSVLIYQSQVWLVLRRG